MSDRKVPATLWRPLYPGRKAGVVAFNGNDVILIDRATSVPWESDVTTPSAGKPAVWARLIDIRATKTPGVFVAKIGVGADRKGQVALAVSSEEAQRAIARRECDYIASRAKA